MYATMKHLQVIKPVEDFSTEQLGLILGGTSGSVELTDCICNCWFGNKNEAPPQKGTMKEA